MKRELPQGFSKLDIEFVIRDWNILYERVMGGNISLDSENFDEVFEDDGYIDRYIWEGNAEFCITTDKSENTTYLSHDMILQMDCFMDSEQCSIEELYSML